jgi:hypothetical protein
MNENKKLVKKYHAFFGLEATIKKNACLIGPSLNMAGMCSVLSYLRYLCLSWLICFLNFRGYELEQNKFFLNLVMLPAAPHRPPSRHHVVLQLEFSRGYLTSCTSISSCLLPGDLDVAVHELVGISIPRYIYPLSRLN